MTEGDNVVPLLRIVPGKPVEPTAVGVGVREVLHTALSDPTHYSHITILGWNAAGEISYVSSKMDRGQQVLMLLEALDAIRSAE